MRNFFIILLLHSCAPANPTVIGGSPSSLPTDYVYNFTTGDETGIRQYEIQDSVDRKWVTIDSIQTKGSGNYTYVLPPVPNYYRLKTVRVIDGHAITYYTKLIHVTFNTVSVTNTLQKTTMLTWTVSGAINVNYFLLEKTLDNKTFSLVKNAAYKGNGTYNYRIARTAKKYTYRITPFFKDGTKGTIINFK